MAKKFKKYDDDEMNERRYKKIKELTRRVKSKERRKQKAEPINANLHFSK